MNKTRQDVIGIGIVGLPGSGKSVAARLLAEHLRINIIVMGDVIRDEAQKRGIPKKPREMRKLMVTLRDELGMDVVAQKCLQKLETINPPQKQIIIDGLRSIPELNAFKNGLKSFYLIGIHSSALIRYKRLMKRDRSDDPTAWDSFEARDKLEVNVGVIDLLTQADYTIENEKDMQNLKRQVQNLVDWFKNKLSK